MFFQLLDGSILNSECVQLISVDCIEEKYRVNIYTNTNVKHEIIVEDPNYVNRIADKFNATKL